MINEMPMPHETYQATRNEIEPRICTGCDYTFTPEVDLQVMCRDCMEALPLRFGGGE